MVMGLQNIPKRSTFTGGLTHIRSCKIICFYVLGWSWVILGYVKLGQVKLVITNDLRDPWEHLLKVSGKYHYFWLSYKSVIWWLLII